jgi:hypothetical protein
MLPRELKAESFSMYPAGAKALAVANLDNLCRLPLSFLPSLLRELIDYDFRFPAECAMLELELAALRALTAAQCEEWFSAFSRITLSAAMERSNWVQQPGEFVEQESAYLWTTHQLDAFRQAATTYGERLSVAAAVSSKPIQRLGICVIGQGVGTYSGTLFRHLRPHGTLFTNCNSIGGLEDLLAAVSHRAETDKTPYANWYIDGGTGSPASDALTRIDYGRLAPVRASLLAHMQSEIAKPGMGPEQLRTTMARLTPGDLGMRSGGDPKLDRFQLKALTEGSGTQIFSTTFVQWTARETLRRAQPHTLLLRFAPRQRQRPMNELLAGKEEATEVDAEGSLIDADMGAYYTWLNMRRLPDADRMSFLVWFEGHAEAIAIGPGLPGGTSSATAMSLGKLVTMIV